MKQKDVNFKVKRYMTKDEYEKDGCPVQYFEFREHEYYGLIAVKTDLAGLNRIHRATAKMGSDKAFDVYVETIAGQTVDEIKEEGYPVEISKSEALIKFLLAPDNSNQNVEKLISEFEKAENDALLIDASLV
jgi:hypothetical protein